MCGTLRQSSTAPWPLQRPSAVSFDAPESTHARHHQQDLECHQESNRQPGFLAEHEEKRGLTRGLMGSGVVAEKYLREAGIPVSLPGNRQDAQKVVEGHIKAFSLAIPMGLGYGIVQDFLIP